MTDSYESYEYEDEDEWETESSDGGRLTSATPTAKVPMSVVRSSVTAVPHNSTNSTLNAKAADEESFDDEEESWEDESEWETVTDSDQPVRAVPPAGGGSNVARLPTREEVVSEYSYYDEDEEEWGESEWEEESGSELVAAGDFWELISDALCRRELVTLVQRMFSGDSVAKSVVARNVVALTTPTRHVMFLLRNSIVAELALKECFSAVGTFYQDVLYHTLVRTGSSFFRHALSPTVKNLSGVAQDYEINPNQVAASKLETNQRELQRVAEDLLNDLFSDEARRQVPRLLRCAMFVAREECRSVHGPGGERYINSFMASNVLGRLLADPTGSKMTPSVSRIALSNLGRVSKLISGLAVPDSSLGSYFSSWCAKQSDRLSSWVTDMCIDPTGNKWQAELTTMGGLPQRERDLVIRFSNEIQTLKQWLITGQKERSGGLTSEERPVLEQALILLRPLATGGSGGPSPTDAIRSVRNPHRKVPAEIPLLQKEIVGLDDYVLGGNGRKLISQGPVVARKKTREEDGHLFLFNDLLLYCKHNPVEERCLFTFSRAYRLHQVVVRGVPETERAAAAGFRVSATAMPAHHDLIFFAANARDRDRWVELIRKKQSEFQVRTLIHAPRFAAREVVKNSREIPVEVAFTDELVMKVVPDTDKVIASFDFLQLREWHSSKLGTPQGEITMDFNAAMGDEEQQDLILKLRGDKLQAISEEISARKAAGQEAMKTTRAALPSFRPGSKAAEIKKDSTGAKQKKVVDSDDASDKDTSDEAVVNAPVSTRGPPPSFLPGDEPRPPKMGDAGGAKSPPKGADTNLRAPPPTFSPADSKGKEDANAGAMVPLEQETVTVNRGGNTVDAWQAYAAGQVKHREPSEARLKRQKAKERRQRMREQGSESRSLRLEEDKRLFLRSLEQSLEAMVEVPDESSLRPAETLSDRQVMDLQRRATVWKRQNRLLKELMYTQYVIAGGREAPGTEELKKKRKKKERREKNAAGTK